MESIGDALDGVVKELGTVWEGARMNENLKETMKKVDDARVFFGMRVEAACLETMQFGYDIAKAIGEISIDEAKDAILNHFKEALDAERHYAEFRSEEG